MNSDHKVVGSTVSNANGEFDFGRITMTMSQDIYKIQATYSNGGATWPTETAFFNVIATIVTLQDVKFFDYPSSGIGGLYGIVTSDPIWCMEEPATVYMENGMFFLYPGNRYDQWSFDNLPQGKYVMWAERNIGNVTYVSARYNVTVIADDKAYLLIYLPTKEPAAYHLQPTPMKNVVHGTVIQSNGAVLPGAKVELYRCQGSAQQLVATGWSNVSGQFQFDNVDVNSYSAQFLVRATFDADGSQRTRDSNQFTVYYANTINVSHDYNVPVTIGYVTTGSLMINSVPSVARIIIDGQDTGYTTPYDVPLKTGAHMLGLAMDGYFCDNTTITVQPDASRNITRTLKLSTGNLSLQISPSNARVFIDGKLAGSSLIVLENKPAGDYPYVIVCDGYTNESGTLTVLPGESVTKEISMVASPGISLSYLVYLIGSLFQAIGHIF